MFAGPNPASLVPVPNPKNERDRVLSEDEWTRLYAEVHPAAKLIVLTAYRCAMRKKEIVKLTWDRVDLKQGLITLREIDTKTKQARQVPMTPDLLQGYRDLAKVRHMGQDRVFTRLTGRAVQSIDRGFVAAVKRAKFHDLRHCGVTNFMRAGVDLPTAMAISGHTSMKSFKRYRTVQVADLKAAAAKLNTLITLYANEVQGGSANAVNG